VTHVRVRSALGALVLSLLLPIAAGAATSQRDALVARWTGASEAQIAAIHDPKARAQARAAFAKLRARLDESVAPVALPDFGASARRELAVPGRYQLSEKIAPPPQQPWYGQILDWLKAQLHKLWNALFGRVHIGRTGSMAIGDLLIALAVAALLFAAIRLLAELQIVKASNARVEALAPSQDARELYARAHRAASSGDYAGASRLLFAAAVVALDLRGIVAEDPSATVGDLRRALRSRAASLVPTFDAVAEPFVASAYAERPVAPADWERANAAFLSFAPEKVAT